MALPQLTPEERKHNLELAAKARADRAKIRAELKAGKISFADILKRADEPVVARLKVSTLIESLPGYGKARAAALLEDIGISTTRRVRGLGARQRDALAEALK
jgi:hypothetical protein